MKPGTHVGAYRLLEPIGEGGMGRVWVAEHAMLGRRAAIKVLHASFSLREEIVTRFFNEARAATAIADPGIVQIFDFGHHTDGSAYIVMELLEGQTLYQRLRERGPFAPADALRVVRQVAKSLGAAHAQGIVHRDLKPENIFLVRDDEVAGGERAKILDFGIAKLVGDPSGQTGTHAVLGTPMFMSPEQCRGAGRVDQRSDVYSLGCVLFALLCGRAPFVAEGNGEMIAMHLVNDPPWPSQFVAGVPAPVEALVMQCLAKDPAHRPASGTELAAAIGQLVGAPVTFAPAAAAVAAAAAGVAASGPYVPQAAAASDARTRATEAAATTLAAAAGVTGAGPVQAARRTGGRGVAWVAVGVLAVGAGAGVLASVRRGNGDGDRADDARKAAAIGAAASGSAAAGSGAAAAASGSAAASGAAGSGAAAAASGAAAAAAASGSAAAASGAAAAAAASGSAAAASGAAAAASGAAVAAAGSGAAAAASGSAAAATGSAAAAPSPAPPSTDADLVSRMTDVLARFAAWASTHAGAPCPSIGDLGGELTDPWGTAFRLTCSDQPVNQMIGALSAGADRRFGTRDDVASWDLAHDVTDAARGPRWVAAHKHAHASPRPPSVLQQAPRPQPAVFDANGLPTERK